MGGHWIIRVVDRVTGTIWFVHQVWYLTETSSHVRPVWVDDHEVLSGQPVGDSAVCA